tara:strand:- start:159 stop:512 length:354 start_codon:yes stop_codon:yes gene_type:complete
VKKYLNIREASRITGLKEHVIRYWDSIDPKTKKIRIDGISTKSKAGTRYFNRDNLKKLQNLKNIIYKDGHQYRTLNLADRLISKKDHKISNFTNIRQNQKNNEKIMQILKKMRNLLI